MELNKNEHYEFAINDLGSNGEGIGRIDGMAVFVEGALPGEEIEARIIKLTKNYAVGKLIKIISPSKDRVAPLCECYARCGGCNLQHLSYNAQLRYKQKKVKDALERIGGIKNVTVNPTIGMDKPFHYRNKAQFPVVAEGASVKIGFYAPRSHSVTEVSDCLIQHPLNKEVLRELKSFMEENKLSAYDEKTHTGIVRHIVTRAGQKPGEFLVCLVINAAKLPQKEDFILRMKRIEGVSGICVCHNQKKTNVVMSKQIETIWGKGFITDHIGQLAFEISPLSFYQVNPTQTKILYDTALRLADLRGTETLIDAYCGIGTISLCAAGAVKKVIGIEEVKEAIQDAKRNSRLNEIMNAEFICGKAEDALPKLQTSGVKTDVVIIDPPRKGCDEKFINSLLEIKPGKIVYVSCEPSTLARDLAVLCKGGYELGEIQPVDMFPQTGHTETVAVINIS